MVIEKHLTGKTIEEGIELLKKMKLKITKGVGEVPELSDIEDTIKEYHNADKYFVIIINANRRKLREVFKGKEYEDATSYIKAHSALKFYCTKIDEAIGIRELSKGNFQNYSLQAFSLQTTFGKDSLIQKYNFFVPMYKLTNSKGFNETPNVFKEDILIRGKRLLKEVTEKGAYTLEDAVIRLVDDASGNELTLKLACNLLNINKKCL